MDYGKKIENIIQDAEITAVLDKGLYKELDNQLMNRQALLNTISDLVAESYKQGFIAGSIEQIDKGEK